MMSRRGCWAMVSFEKHRASLDEIVRPLAHERVKESNAIWRKSCARKILV